MSPQRSAEEIRAWVSQKVTVMEGFADQVSWRPPPVA
jgi:hypothetical protein